MEIWAQPNWVPWLRLFQRLSQVSAWAEAFSRLNWGRTSHQGHTRGCWQDLVPPELLAGGHSQLLGMWALHRAAYDMVSLLYPSEQMRRASKSESKMEITAYHKRHPITLALFLSLEANHRSIQHSRSGDHARAWIPGGVGSPGTILDTTFSGSLKQQFMISCGLVC